MKILLVDDETLLLDSMESMVDWNFHNLELVGKASSGFAALQICENNTPDLVITDIKMRDMDGLELTRQLSVLYPKTKVIIMSSYDDFSYAKRAIELKAQDYLLKMQTNKDEFLQAILKVKDEVSATNSNTKIQHDGRQTILKQIFTGKLEFDDLADDDEFLTLSKKHSNWIMAAACFDSSVFNVEEHFSGINLMLKRLFDDILCIEKNNILYSFIPLSNDINQIRPSIIRLKSQLSVQYTPCSVGVSSIVQSRNVNSAFLQAESAIEEIFFTGNNSTLYWDDLNIISMHNNAPPPFEIFTSDIASGNFVAINEKLNVFFAKCAQDRHYTPKRIFGLVEYVLLSLARLSHNFSSESNVNNDIAMLESLTSLESLRKETLQILSDIQTSTTHISGSPIIEKTIAFIMKNYKEPISLKEISEHVSVSPAYLSKLFKKETGENITYFIQDIKMKYAKQMLQDGDYNIVEISRNLGFDSASYFTFLFQKHFGCSPSEYRKNNV